MTKETITLAHPFTFEGAEFTEITMRRPKLRDMKKADGIKNNMLKSISMLADLTEQPPKLIEEIDMEDFQTLTAKLGEFMGVSADQIA